MPIDIDVLENNMHVLTVELENRLNVINVHYVNMMHWKSHRRSTDQATEFPC